MLVVPQVRRAGFWPWDTKTSVLTSSIDTGLHKVSKGDKSQQPLEKFHPAGLPCSFLAEGTLNLPVLSPDNRGVRIS